MLYPTCWIFFAWPLRARPTWFLIPAKLSSQASRHRPLQIRGATLLEAVAHGQPEAVPRHEDQQLSDSDHRNFTISSVESGLYVIREIIFWSGSSMLYNFTISSVF